MLCCYDYIFVRVCYDSYWCNLMCSRNCVVNLRDDCISCSIIVQLDKANSPNTHFNRSSTSSWIVTSKLLKCLLNNCVARACLYYYAIIFAESVESNMCSTSGGLLLSSSRRSRYPSVMHYMSFFISSYERNNSL